MVMLIKRIFKSRKKRKFIFKSIFIELLLVLIINILLVNLVPFNKILSNTYELNIDKKNIFLRLGINGNYKSNNVLNVFKDNVIDKKKVYIYNTHQGEEYNGTDIYSASLNLKKELEIKNIDVYLESTNIAEELKKNNYNYNQSYRITRKLLERAFIDDYDLYIDLHRDSSSKDVTTIMIDNKSYARIMFVIGKKHESYINNFNTASYINEYIKSVNTSLSRGIYTRENSSYNQDLKENIILIELGGPYNTVEEVNNTIRILADSIEYYLNN